MKTKILLFALVATLSGCVSCSHGAGTDATAETDSLTFSFDWTPEGFREAHHPEWLMIMRATEMFQNPDEVDYSEVDRWVREYIQTQGIALPQETYSQIMAIDSLCQSRFNILDESISNLEMRMADGTTSFFADYIVWLLRREALAVEGTGIDFDEEERHLQEVREACYMCCDSISGAFGGSGGWIGRNDVYEMESQMMKSMYTIVVSPQFKCQPLPYLLTTKHFREECAARFANYKQVCDEQTTPKRAKVYLDRYAESMTHWLDYRSKVEKRITDPTLRSRYAYLTRCYAKEQYVHLKNNVFSDLGMVSEGMYDHCYLHLDCSDEEMMKYNYESALKRYMESD